MWSRRSARPSLCATSSKENDSMEWIRMSMPSIFRGASWGFLTSFIGGTVFSVFFLVPTVLDVFEIGSRSKDGTIYFGYAILFFLASFPVTLLTVIPAIVFGTIGGMGLGLLIHLDGFVGSSTFASVSAGGIAGLETTLLLVAALVFALGLGMDFLLFALYAIVIGTIAGSISGWRLYAEERPKLRNMLCH